MSDSKATARGCKPGQPKQSTRGLWADTRDGTVYNGTLRSAVAAIGGSQVAYHRLWRALRKQGRWPTDIPIRPATTVDVQAAKRTVVYEVEMVLPPLSGQTIEELVLRAGGWLKRITMQKLPHGGRQLGHTRCVWLVSGLADLGWLRRLVDGHYGRIQEVDHGQYRHVYRKGDLADASQ